MDPLIISSVASGLGAGLNLIKGLGQQDKAEDILRENKRPTYRTPQAARDSLALAEAQAGAGLSDGAKQVYTQNAERGLSATLHAITANGGNLNNVGAVYGTYNTGLGNLALLDEDARARDRAALYAQLNQAAEYEDKEFQINQWAPYADAVQAAAALRKQGNDNINTGINNLITAGTNYATGKLYGNEANNVFPTGGGAPRYSVNPQVVRTTPSLATPSYVNAPAPNASQMIRMRFPGLTGGYTMIPNG
jgi:hypothetical protein